MTDYVVSSGVEKKITLFAGDTMSVFDTGKSKLITVSSGGMEFVYGGGAADSTLLSGRSILSVGNGGAADLTSVTRYSSETVASGGIASASNVKNGTEVVFSGGTAVNTILKFNGSLYLSGGHGEHTSLTYEGYETVYAGGVENSSLINNGVQTINGGRAFDTAMDAYSNGQAVQKISNGGIASHTTMSGSVSGGTAFQYVDDGGEAIDTIVGTEATIYVEANGLARDVELGSGGFAGVASGGTIEHVTITDAYLGLDSGSRATGGIDFSGTGGILAINGTKMPTTVISGFASGDQIDLVSIAYSAGETATVNQAGIVTVSAGGKSYNLHIAGAMVGETDYAVGSGVPGITLTKDDTPMTFLHPPAVASAGLDGGWNGAVSAATLTAADFASKVFGGGHAVASGSHFGSLHTQETRPVPVLIPVSITQLF